MCTSAAPANEKEGASGTHPTWLCMKLLFRQAFDAVESEDCFVDAAFTGLDFGFEVSGLPVRQ